jgi:hypothetical protein
MNSPKSFSRSALIAALYFGANLSHAAPSSAELLSTHPNSIVGPFVSNPSHNYTPWQMREFSGEVHRAKVVYKAEVMLNGIGQVGQEFLLGGDFFALAPGSNFHPTPKLIEFTKPSDLAGGDWTFGYESIDFSLKSGPAYHVISWTWNESPPPQRPVIAGNAAKPLTSAIELNRSAVRVVKGKKPKRAISLLARQQKLLRLALAANQ